VKESECQREFSDDETTPIETREHNKCETCGEEYGQPILTENLSGHSQEEYYACSRCLSKVEVTSEKRSKTLVNEVVVREPHEKVEIAAEEIRNISSGKIEVNVQASCQHELGYLKKRDRASPIPDECLICTKMIECM
jgi:hypothetical protein